MTAQPNHLPSSLLDHVQGGLRAPAQRVAIVESAAGRRAELAREVVTGSALELVLSSTCLADAAALREVPDVVMLGACERGSYTCEARSTLEARGCRVVELAGSGPGPHHPGDGPGEGSSAAVRLSARERDALELYASGCTLREVAATMYVTENTAGTYLRRVRAKLRAAGVEGDSKLELYRWACAAGVVADELVSVR